MRRSRQESAETPDVFVTDNFGLTILSKYPDQSIKFHLYCSLEASSCKTCLKMDEEDLETLKVGSEAAEV